MSGDAKRPAPGEQPYVLQQTKALTVGMAVEVDMALPLQGITVVAEQSSLGAVLPAIKLDAVLTFEGATDDGQLIQAVGAPWLRILELIERDPDEVYRIDPRQWEEIIAGALQGRRLRRGHPHPAERRPRPRHHRDPQGHVLGSDH